MGEESIQAVVAGHICLDLIPRFEDRGQPASALFVPGRLIEVGPAIAAIGGVANTGLALHRLGIGTQLMAKVGTDIFGRAILDLLEELGPELGKGMIHDREGSTSYTFVISPPHTDRMFLHCPGVNDTFDPEEIDYQALQGRRLFHFGYPPLMRRIYSDGGRGAAEMFQRVRALGLATSLDMTVPDPNRPAGRIDWPRWLQEVLPHVDLFLPSLDEILFMLEGPQGDADAASLDPVRLRALAGRLLEMGVGLVVFKLGDLGLYLRSGRDEARLPTLLKAGGRESWRDLECYRPCFKAEVVGTTGSGDSTIAGFLGAILKGLGPAEALRTATAVGACSVEQADATSGVPSWEQVLGRLARGWPQLGRRINLSSGGWREDHGHWSRSGS